MIVREYRPDRPGDRADAYLVCVGTGADGGDATGLYSSDELLPDVWCGPYLDLEPELAFVVEHEGRVVGYVVATADTAGFVARYRSEWLPAFAARYPLEPAAGSGRGSVEQSMIAAGHHTERMLVPELATHPAHLHIDLLPAAQGAGLGRRLIETLVAALAARGVLGVHLGVSATNVGARAFYGRLGFTELPSSRPDDVRLGLRIGPAD